jgi:multicomponent K+:H+ antiporter subunit D
MALLLLSGFLTLVALSRAGIRYFWTQPMSSMPALRALEVLPVAALLATSLALSIEAGPVMRHASDTAQGLFKPTAYRNAVMGARQVPNPPAREAKP